MTLNTFTNGTAADADEVNDNFRAFKIQEVYTSTGFDVSVAGGSQNTSASHELNSISSTNIGTADYVIIEATLQCKAENDGGDSDGGHVYYKIEAKEIGGSYSDSLTEKAILENDVQNTGSGDSTNITVVQTIKWTHTLTAGEKSNGVQFQITGRCTTGTYGNAASITNIQTALYLGA